MGCTAPVRSMVRKFASRMVMFAITAGLASAAEQRVQEVNYSSVVGHDKRSMQCPKELVGQCGPSAGD
jgi:hypothetical protein